jgi:hypothetical protein
MYQNKPGEPEIIIQAASSTQGTEHSQPFQDNIRGVSKEKLTLFVGKGSDVYLKKWENRSSWNWASFLFGAYWLLYRKMYLFFFIYLISGFAVINLIGSQLLDVMTEGVYSGRLSLLQADNSITTFVLIAYICFKVVIGATGNQLYFYHTRHKIIKITEDSITLSSSPEKQIKEAGGASLFVPLLLILIPLVIASSIALYYFYNVYHTINEHFSQNITSTNYGTIQQETSGNLELSQQSLTTASTNTDNLSSIASDINGYNWSDTVGYDRLVVIVGALMKGWEQENIKLDGVALDREQDSQAITELIVTLYKDSNYTDLSLTEMMDVIKDKLLQEDMSIEVRDALNEDLYYAVADDNYNEVVRLLDQGAAPAQSASIIAAARNKNALIIGLLIQYGADPDYFSSGETPLSILVQGDEVELVSRLLDLGANPEMGTPASSPLRIAVEAGYKDMVQLLLSHGADINGFSISDKSMIQVAEESGYTEIYRLLKEHEEKISD